METTRRKQSSTTLLKAKILSSKFHAINVGDIGIIEEETKHGAAIRFEKEFEFTHQKSKLTKRTYWFSKNEYELI
jgi:hypothetical protein